jgi:hypothetical protein
MSSQNTPVLSPIKAPVKKVASKKVAKNTTDADKVPVAAAKAKKVSKKLAEKVEEKVEEEKAPTKNTRAPSLAAKYNKYIQFTFYMIRAINAKRLENNEDVLMDQEKFFENAHVFDTVDNQQSFVSEFLDNKGIAKEMRAHLADQKKAAKVAEKEAAKAAKVAEKAAEKEAAKLAKAAEKAAAKAANNTNTNTNTNTKKATKKTTSKKGSDPVDETDLVTSLVTMATTTNQPTTIVDEEEPELDVRPFNHDGVDYLIDDNNNLYDSSTHDMVGSFDVVNRNIIRV